MHVALVTAAFPHPRAGRYLGIERLAKDLARELPAEGLELTVVTTFWNGGGARDRYGEATVVRVPDTSCLFGRWASIGDSHYWSWGYRVGRVLWRDLHPDVVHCLSPLLATTGLSKRGFPVLTTFHHREITWHLRDLLHRPMHKLLEARAYRSSALVTTPSVASARVVSSTYGVPPRRVRVTPWGVDPHRFPSKAHEGDPEVRLLYVGPYEPRKGLAHLLHAVAFLRKDGVPVRLTTYGKGAQRSALARMSLDLGIADHVELGGYVEDPDDTVMPRLYGAADIFVLPSLQEGFGFVLVEAMASGLPVVCTNISAMPEVVGDAGLLVPPADSSALAHAIRVLAEDSNRRDELSQRARARVEALFTWDKTIPKLIAVYEEARSVCPSQGAT